MEFGEIIGAKNLKLQTAARSQLFSPRKIRSFLLHYILCHLMCQFFYIDFGRLFSVSPFLAFSLRVLILCHHTSPTIFLPVSDLLIPMGHFIFISFNNPFYADTPSEKEEGAAAQGFKFLSRYPPILSLSRYSPNYVTYYSYPTLFADIPGQNMVGEGRRAGFCSQ